MTLIKTKDSGERRKKMMPKGYKTNKKAWNRKINDEPLIEAYQELKSCWAVAKKFGMCGQSVHERLQKLGIIEPINIFSEEDKKKLKREYQKYKDFGKLDELAKEMGRTKQFICRQAKALGLTDLRHKRKYASVWKYISEKEARWWMDKFKKTSLGLGRFCKKNKIDDLGFSKAMREHFPDEYDHVIESKAPVYSMYKRGRQFEYRIRDNLKNKGFFVLRSPASKSPIDLVAIKKGLILLIQCKTGGEFAMKEWNELFDLSEGIGAIPILVGRYGYKEIQYFKLTGKKDGSKRPQPRIQIEISELATA